MAVLKPADFPGIFARPPRPPRPPGYFHVFFSFSSNRSFLSLVPQGQSRSSRPAAAGRSLDFAGRCAVANPDQRTLIVPNRSAARLRYPKRVQSYSPVARLVSRSEKCRRLGKARVKKSRYSSGSKARAKEAGIFHMPSARFRWTRCAAKNPDQRTSSFRIERSGTRCPSTPASYHTRIINQANLPTILTVPTRPPGLPGLCLPPVTPDPLGPSRRPRRPPRFQFLSFPDQDLQRLCLPKPQNSPRNSQGPQGPQHFQFALYPEKLAAHYLMQLNPATPPEPNSTTGR